MNKLPALFWPSWHTVSRSEATFAFAFGLFYGLDTLPCPSAGGHVHGMSRFLNFFGDHREDGDYIENLSIYSTHRLIWTIFPGGRHAFRGGLTVCNRAVDTREVIEVFYQTFSFDVT